jgi:hypothetical protein
MKSFKEKRYLGKSAPCANIQRRIPITRGDLFPGAVSVSNAIVR